MYDNKSFYEGTEWIEEPTTDLTPVTTDEAFTTYAQGYPVYLTLDTAIAIVGSAWTRELDQPENGESKVNCFYRQTSEFLALRNLHKKMPAPVCYWIR